MDATVEIEDDLSSRDPNSTQGSIYHPYIVKYGWLILLVCGFYWIIKKLSRSSLSDVGTAFYTEEEIRRREDIERARMRFQENLNEAILHQKEKQAEIRSSTNNKNSRLNPAKLKQRFRPDDYNPLMGDTSSCRYRPTSRFGSAGG